MEKAIRRPNRRLNSILRGTLFFGSRWKNRQFLTGLELRADFRQRDIFWEKVIQRDFQDTGQEYDFAIRHAAAL